MPSLKRLTKKITSLTGNKKSTIAKASDIAIGIKSQEACPLDLAPTSSTTAALAFGDALAIALLESKGFTKKDFASSHPAGKLGKKLITQVKHLMHAGDDIPVSSTHLRAHETGRNLVCRLLLEKKNPSTHSNSLRILLSTPTL